jgi:hypothetical protein
MNRTIRVMAVVCLLALAAPAFGQYYYLPGGNFVVPAEPWRRSTDGGYYPADDHPTGTILYGPDLYWNGRGFVEGSELPRAEYYNPRPYRPDWSQSDAQHFREHYRGGRP